MSLFVNAIGNIANGIECNINIYSTIGILTGILKYSFAIDTIIVPISATITDGITENLIKRK
jgi:hypothetical protein